jgi:hypothetical protein
MDGKPSEASPPAAAPVMPGPVVTTPLVDFTISGTGNGLAPVSALPVDGGPSLSGGRDATESAAQSAVNQAVLRHAAYGEVLHPELGRVEVSARLRDGEVDLRITTQHAGATNALIGRADALVSDVRSANVQVGRLDIDSRRRDGSAQDTGSSGENMDRGGHPSREQQETRDEPVHPAPVRRVRIVL